MEKQQLLELKKTAVRIRRHIIDAVYHAGSGHPGGSLSCTDILTVLYFKHMNVNINDPNDLDRDRFVMSKGHCAPALYATLAEKGFFSTEELKNLRKIDSFLQGHPSMKDVPGVDMSTGSLGQGISASVGMALAGKLDKKDYRVYVIIGDGECQEGQVWEALMAAAHYKLDNLTVFLDHNGLQIDGKITEVMSPECLPSKFRAFNWNVIEIDGNDLIAIDDAVEKAKATKGMPTMVVANTVKGKGVSFMEGEYGWHGKAPNKEERDKAISELDKAMEQNGG
jgi:transketolase